MTDCTLLMPEPEQTVADPPDSAPEILAEVCVYVAGDLVKTYSIEHGEYLVGRDASCAIFVDASQVSRHHARLIFSAFELVVEDLGSSNGVFIDGVQVLLPTRIRLEQEVQIGSARLFIRLKENAARHLAAALWDADLGLGPVREQLVGKKYKVITTINRGGMGVILQARDLRIRRTVAMKVMKTGSQFSRENVLRFIDEAQLTGQLEHPNIVPVYELAIDDQGETFYTMKFVRGITLDDVLRGIRTGNEQMIARYPLGTLLIVFQKVCDAVAFAHAKGVVHRDLKPENIMIGAFGEVLVMDWGLAKNITAGRRDSPAEAPVEGVSVVAKFDDLRGFETMNGLIVGTPPYISPEQARGELENIDPRSDIYVLGAILYTILTLRPPVEGASVDEVVEKILASKISPPASFNIVPKSSRHPVPEPAPEPIVFEHCPGRRIPDGLSAVGMKALQLDAAERYQKVEDLQADVAAFQGGFAPKAERASLLKHVLLFAGRHKREAAIVAIFAVLFNVAVASFFWSIMHEKNRALESERRAHENSEQLASAVAELRGTAPTFYEDARSLIFRRDFAEALNKIEYAIRQVPNEAEYHLLRANILQSQLRWEEAVDAYEDALARNPKLAAARENLALTKRLVAATGPDREPDAKQLTELYKALEKQKRLAEASVLAERLGIAPDRQGPPRLFGMKLMNRALRGRVQAVGEDKVTADLGGLPLSDVLPFLKTRPQPITTLNLNNVGLPDLTALAGLPLHVLSLAGCTAVTDLSPLEGMPLERLTLSRTGVRDLTPLAGMPLRELVLEHCAQLRDVSPLVGCRQLESLVLPHQVRDIEFLRSMSNLRALGYKIPAQPVADFWRAFDAKEE